MMETSNNFTEVIEMKEVKNEVNETENLEEAFEAEFTEEELERVSTLEHLKGIGSNLKEDASRAWNSKPIKAVRKGTRVVLGVTATVAAIGTGIAIGKEILKKDENPLLDVPEDETIDGDFEVEDVDEVTEENSEETSNGNIEVTEEN